MRTWVRMAAAVPTLDAFVGEVGRLPAASADVIVVPAVSIASVDPALLRRAADDQSMPALAGPSVR